MTGNPAFPHPPVDLALLKAALEGLSIAIGEAIDGGKKAVVEKARQRESVVKMLRTLSHYVESVSTEVTTLLSSGFELLTVTRSAPQPLQGASIRRIDQGVSGNLLVKIQSIARAWSYELRYASLGPDGIPGSWTSLPVTTVRSLTSCTGLTPGVIYAFQVRALGRLGYSDWSDSVTKMCT
jgi:hypothetical protein